MNKFYVEPLSGVVAETESKLRSKVSIPRFSNIVLIVEDNDISVELIRERNSLYVNMTLPDDFSDEELPGKVAKLLPRVLTLSNSEIKKCTINGEYRTLINMHITNIKRLPALDLEALGEKLIEIVS